MPTQAELEDALRNADAAGDTEAATQLANALHGMMTQRQKTTYQPDSGDMFVRGLTGGLSDYVGAAGEYVGDKIGRGIKALEGKQQPAPFSYNDALKDVRAGNSQYRDQSPVRAYGGEITGGVMSPIYNAAARGVGYLADGAKALPWAKTILQGGGLGLLGGLTNAEGQGGGLPSLQDLNRSASIGTDVGMVAPVVMAPISKAVGWAGNKIAGAAQGALDKLPFNQESAAVRKIAENMARDNITPEQLAANRAALGPNANAVDAAGRVDPNSGVWLGGRNIFGMADTLANQPGKTADIAEGVLKPRAQTAATEIINSVDDHLAPGADLYDNIGELAKQRSTSAQPLYEQAFGPNDKIPIKSPLVERLMSRPMFQKGLREGLADIADENAISGGNTEAFKTYFEGENFDDPNIIIKKTPTLRVLDAAKRGLDGILSNGGDEIRNPITGVLTKKGMRVDQMRRALVDELDKATGGENGLYAQARRAWAGPSAVIDASQQGRAFMNGDPEVTLAAFNKMSPDEQNMFRIGAAREIQASIEKTGKVPASLKNILNPESKQRQLLQQIFPNFDGFLQTVGSVVRKGETARMLGGSQTFARGAAANDLGLDLGGAAIEAARGNLFGAARGALRGTADWLARPAEVTRDTMGNYLLSPDAFPQLLLALQQKAQLSAQPSAGRQLLLGARPNVPALLGGYAAQNQRP